MNEREEVGSQAAGQKGNVLHSKLGTCLLLRLAAVFWRALLTTTREEGDE